MKSPSLTRSLGAPDGDRGRSLGQPAAFLGDRLRWFQNPEGPGRKEGGSRSGLVPYGRGQANREKREALLEKAPSREAAPGERVSEGRIKPAESRREESSRPVSISKMRLVVRVPLGSF